LEPSLERVLNCLELVADGGARQTVGLAFDGPQARKDW
jgi:hypothetical protein